MEQLNGQDASFIYRERIHAPMHISMLHLFDQSSAPGGKIGFKQIMAHVDSRLDRTPRALQRLVRVPLNLDHPYWVDDNDFDIEFHVRHLALPEPGDWRQLCILAARLHSRPLDLNRPLWEMYVIEGLRQVEGLPKGSFAILTKIHQAALGAGQGVEVADAILDEEPETEGGPGNAVRGKIDPPRPGELLVRAWLNNLVQPFRFARVLREAAPELMRIGNEVTENLPRNTGVPRTRFNTTISPHRVIDGRAFALDDLKAIRDCVDGATINDVVIAICGGAMRHYLDRKSELPSQSLSLMAPVAIEKGGRGSGKSEVIQLTVPAFTDVADPLERLRSVTGETRGNRQIRRALGADILTDMNAHAPAATAALGARLYTRLAQASGGNPFFNATITNVPGPQQPLYLQGARLIDHYGIGTLTDGAALTHMVHSYCGEVTITATACRRVVPDPATYADCLMDSFDDLMTATAPQRRPMAS